MQIQASQPILELDGKPIQIKDEGPLTLGKAIAYVLVNDRKSSNHLKSFMLGTKFYQDEVVEIDEVDLKEVEARVEKTEVYGSLVAGQVLKLLNDQKK